MDHTIHDIRRRNLELLIQDKQFGSQGAVAAASHIHKSYISQILTRFERNGKTVELGSKLARKIEAGCGKPPGWMDTSHDDSEEDNELIVLYSRMTSEMRDILLRHARLMVKPKHPKWPFIK